MLCKDIFLNAKWDNRICVLFEEGAIYQELKDKNEKIFSLKSENRNKKRIVKKIVEYCNKEKIDIITVHHEGTSCNIIYIMLQKRLKNVKFVRYLHLGSGDIYYCSDIKNKLKNIIVKKVMQKAFDISDLLIFISKSVEKSFVENFKIGNKNKTIIYNGINNSFFGEVPVKKQFNIIYVGRLVKVKGVDILLHAIKKVCKKNVNICVTIVGDGEERQNLERMAKELDVESNVSFVGRQGNVKKWLDENSLFVYPSRWEEGFGISVVEAMARGCIPITFKKGGLLEIIENETNGYLIDTVDYEKLADKILEIFSLPTAKIDEIRKNAIETSKKFTIDNTIKRLEEEYNNL